eukprot:COSAG02_NODE_10700_length_1881_cov_1.002806_3_plen_83_part_00
MSAMQFDEHVDNAVNGRPSCGNRWLLQEVLRDEWGHEGHVVSDVRVPIAAIIYGLISATIGPCFIACTDDLFSVCSAEACQI